MEKTPLHIMIADPHLQGGGQVRYVATLAQGLHEKGHRVTIACRPGSVLADHARGCATALDRFQFRGGLRMRSWTNDHREALRFIRNEKPDILHVNGSQDHWTFAFANGMLGKPVPLVRTRHNTYKVKTNLPNRILNRKHTDFQIVVCHSVRETLSRHPAFCADRMLTIHNGVDAHRYKADTEARRRARAEFHYSDNDIVCGIVARLVPAKGHTFLFQAAALLQEKHPELRIAVLGQGVLEEALRKEAETLGIADRVQFLGFRDDMNYCVQAFDIGAQPSIDCDTSSFSMKEQMAAGIPLIASDYGGLTEIIDDGVEGLIVPAGTVEPLAAALERLLSDASLRTAMAEKGKARVAAEFSSEVFVSRTLEVYQQLAAEKRRRKESASC
ncbi:MAG TPA: glycosyltransferase family 4 protein [Candidatus Hydrogenedentes bacterium]|nr:glycosyltransferase family 4 protein [Candidatus Hydrogenedentota bacterium]